MGRAGGAGARGLSEGVVVASLVRAAGQGRGRSGRSRPGPPCPAGDPARWVHTPPHAEPCPAPPRPRRSSSPRSSSASAAACCPPRRPPRPRPTSRPAGRRFHTYAEMTAEVAAVAAAHPDIVERFSIGTSYQGRQLWAAKVSDNVAVDEAEPEVLFDGLHHSDEHMSLEMTLHILHWLVDGYGTDPRITGIVNTREIWIVFAVNPDGAEFDIARRPVPPLAQEPPAERERDRRHRPQPQLRLPLGRRRQDAARTRSRSPTAGRARSRRPRPARSATSSPAGSWTAGSRSASRSRSTSTGASSCGRTATRRSNVPADMTAQDHAALVAIGKHMAAHQRLPARAGERPVRHLGDDPRLRVRHVPDLRVHLRDVQRGLPEVVVHRRRDRRATRRRSCTSPSAPGARCPCSATAVRDARCGALDDDLEVGAGLDREPGRDRHGARVRALGAREPGRDLVRRHGAPARRRAVGAHRRS